MTWFDHAVSRLGRSPHELSDRELIFYLLERNHEMALDFSKLTASVTALTLAADAEKKSVDKLIAVHTDPTDTAAAQAAIDAAVVAVDDVTAKVTTETAAVDAVLPAPPVDAPTA